MATKLLRVGWHREHFLSPLLQLVAADAGKTIELVECPGGTGEMQVKLKNNEIDVCIALTDALIAGLANGQTSYKLCGRYIASPLRWAIITGKDSKYNSVDDIKGTTFGISRQGSGSQVMASVLALEQGWTGEEQPKFKIEGQFVALRNSVNNGDTSVFLWEWFTTKPHVDSGEVRFIGHVNTPWPCWQIASRNGSDDAAVAAFLASLEPYVNKFDSEESRAGPAVDYVTETFGQQRADVVEWLGSVKWESRLAEISENTLSATLHGLEQAGVIKKESDRDVSAFINTNVARIVE